MTDNGTSEHGTGATAAEVAEKVKSILAELLHMDKDDISEDSSLVDDLGADSLLFLELFEELRDALDLDIDFHEIGKYLDMHPISKVGELAELLHDYIDKGEDFFREKISARAAKE